MEAPFDDQLLDKNAVAKFLGRSPWRAYQLMNDGTLPVVRIGRSVRVSRKSLERWIRDQEEKNRAELAG